ncbi:mCG54425, partial [Mus musculus]
VSLCLTGTRRIPESSRGTGCRETLGPVPASFPTLSRTTAKHMCDALGTESSRNHGFSNSPPVLDSSLSFVSHSSLPPTHCSPMSTSPWLNSVQWLPKSHSPGHKALSWLSSKCQPPLPCFIVSAKPNKLCPWPSLFPEAEEPASAETKVFLPCFFRSNSNAASLITIHSFIHSTLAEYHIPSIE